MKKLLFLAIIISALVVPAKFFAEEIKLTTIIPKTSLDGFWDSNWFHVEDNNSYIKNHDLGYVPKFFECWYCLDPYAANAGTSANPIVQVCQYMYAGSETKGYRIENPTSNQFELHTAAALYYRSGSDPSSKNTGYYRIYAR